MSQCGIEIYTNRLCFMQACLYAAEHHGKYLTGLIAIDNAEVFIEKRRRNYLVNLPRSEKDRARSNGKATCELLLYKHPANHYVESNKAGVPIPNDKVQWVLFSTEGESSNKEYEDLWNDLKNNPLTVAHFQMVQVATHIKPSTPEGKANKPPIIKWSWKFAQPYLDVMTERASKSASEGDEKAIRQMVKRGVDAARFVAARMQMIDLFNLMDHLWRRQNSRDRVLFRLPAISPVSQLRLGRESVNQVKAHHRAKIAEYKLQTAKIKGESQPVIYRRPKRVSRVA